MRFTINREELLKGLLTASRAVAVKTAVPVLSNLKIDLNDKGLFITGSNYDLTIQTLVPYKNGETEIIRNYKEGAVLVNSRIISDIARKMESEELVFEVIDSTIATISDNRSEYKLQCIRAEEYPDLDLEIDGTEVNLTKDEFSSMVNQTAFAASTKEQRLILTSLNLEAGNGLLVATATDAARMARKEIKIAEGINFIANIPARMIVEIDHLLEGVDSVNIAVSDKKALFSFDRTIVATRLVAGDYPNTKNIIPHVTNYTLQIKANELLKAVDRANVLSSERENVVELSLSSDEVELMAKSNQIGSAREKIETFQFEGEPLKISFNSEFVMAAVKALGSEDVVFLFVGEMKAFVIKNASDDSVIQIVTPVRTYY